MAELAQPPKPPRTAVSALLDDVRKLKTEVEGLRTDVDKLRTEVGELWHRGGPE